MATKRKEELIQKDGLDMPFVQIPNSLAQNTSLTIEARGLLLFMLSLPSDWVIHKSWIQKENIKLGRDRLDRIWKELQEAGYVEKIQNVTSKGTFEGVTWIVRKFTPQEINLINEINAVTLKSRITEKPYNGKSTPTKKQLNKETLIQSIGSGSNKNLTIDLPQSENLIIREANEAQLHIWLNLRAFTKSEPSQKNVVIGSMPRTSDLDLIDWVIEIAAECDCDLTSREDCIRFCQAALMELNTKNNNQADTANIFYRLKLAENATYDEEGSFPSWPERLGKWLL